MTLIPSPSAAHARTIVVVDGDARTRESIAEYLAIQGYATQVAETARQLDEILACTPVDLVILDVVLPDESGLTVCQRLHGDDGPAIIMISAMSDEADRVVGLEMGADDYVCKPFGPREVLARVRAVLRRADSTSSVRRYRRFYRFVGLNFDIGQRRVTSGGGASLDLTEAEGALLSRFLDRPGEALDRAFLLGGLEANCGSADDYRAVDVRVSRLRQKLATAFGVDPVKTLRGKGYVLDADVVAP